MVETFAPVSVHAFTVVSEIRLKWSIGSRKNIICAIIQLRLVVELEKGKKAAKVFNFAELFCLFFDILKRLYSFKITSKTASLPSSM